MQYLELYRKLENFYLFSLADIRQIEPKFHRRRLNEWQEKGYIQKIIKGYYVFSGRALDECALFGISNRIYSPSYVSCETALAHYGLIPESVYGITCVSTRKTMSFKTPLSIFIYRTIRPSYYFGFEYIKMRDSLYCKIASPEKALLDYFYLNPSIKNNEAFASLRINKEVFLRKIQLKKLDSYSDVYEGNQLKKRIVAFREFVKHA